MGIDERDASGRESERAGAKRCEPQGCFIDAGAVVHLWGLERHNKRSEGNIRALG